MKTTHLLFLSLTILINVFPQDDYIKRNFKQQLLDARFSNETRDPHKLKIDDRDIPIHTYNQQSPSEQQLNTIKNVIKDDFLVNDDTIGGFYRNHITTAMDSQGNFVIAWADTRNTTPSDIYFQRYNSMGTAQGKNTRANDPTAIGLGQRNPSVSMDSQGNFVIAWEDNRSDNSDIYFQRYNSNGIAQGINSKANNDAGSDDQWSPSISMDSQGNFVIVWEDHRNAWPDIYYQHYNLSGEAQGTNTKVNDNTNFASQISPSVSMNSQGDFVIVWADTRNYNYYDIYFQRYNSNGTAKGKNTKANDDSGNIMKGFPTIAMDGGGNFVIAWEDQRNDNSDIYFQRYDSSGTAQGSNNKANNDTSNASQISPSLSIDSQGNFVIAWEDYRSQNSFIYFQQYNSNGTAQGTNIKTNDDFGSANQNFPSVSMYSQGNFIIVWYNSIDSTYEGNIYFQRYNSSGIAQGINVKINDDTGSESQGSPSISIDSQGNFVISWVDYRNGNSDIYYQRYNSSGLAQGINCKVNDDTVNASQNNPSISTDSHGNNVIVWVDSRNIDGYFNSDIYYQLYNSNGMVQGTNRIANYDLGAHQYSPSVSMNSQGNFVIAWEEAKSGGPAPNFDIYYQRFSVNGIAQGKNSKVNDTIKTGQHNPSISINSQGNFVIAWEGYWYPNQDIYYQQYDSNGIVQGTTIMVNDNDGNAVNEYPSISVDSQGNFVIVWMDRRSSTDNADIYFQRYNSNGMAQGIKVKVNDDTGSAYQGFPSISMDSQGNFIIVWQDYRYDSNYPDIIGQRYFSDGTPNGSNYRIVADGPNHGERLPVVCCNDLNIVFAWDDDRNSIYTDIYAKIVGWDWDGVTSVSEIENNLPQEFSLSQNYPNPFNPVTKIKFSIPSNVKREMSNVLLKVYDILGNEIAILVNEEKQEGNYDVDFKAKNLPSGVYFYQLKAGNFMETKKMILLR